MNEQTLNILIQYVVALFDEGVNAVHVSGLIPCGINVGWSGTKPKGWTSFVEIPSNLLPSHISYDKSSGWFRLYE